MIEEERDALSVRKGNKTDGRSREMETLRGKCCNLEEEQWEGKKQKVRGNEKTWNMQRKLAEYKDA